MVEGFQQYEMAYDIIIHLLQDFAKLSNWIEHFLSM
jgi:hypothetical protein